MPSKFCPKCNSDLKKRGIRWVESGENSYDVWLNSYGELEYEHNEFYGSGDGRYCCVWCGFELPIYRENEIKQILSNSKWFCPQCGEIRRGDFRIEKGLECIKCFKQKKKNI